MPGKKYGILLTPVLANEAPALGALDADTVTGVDRLARLAHPSVLENWRGWMGSMAWDDDAQTERIYAMTTMPSERPGVTDHENKALEVRMNRVWQALLLVRMRHPVNGSSLLVTGALGEDGRPATLQTWSHIDAVAMPYYRSRPAFFHAYPFGHAPEPWFDEWREFHELLHTFHHGKVPPILHLALNSLCTGLTSRLVTFRIPDLVRAADCVLATRKSKGKADFVDRTMKIAPHLAKDPFLGPDTAKRLGELYDLRSECVHGKVPFENLQGQGDAGEDEAARIEFLAERVARACVTSVVRKPAKYALFASRPSLEQAWLAGDLPP